MTWGPLIAVLSVSLIVGAALSPTAALAGGGYGVRAGGMAGGGSPPGSQSRPQIQGGGQHHRFTPPPGFHHHNFKPHPGFRPFFSSGGASLWAPPLYFDGWAYSSAPAYYVPVPVLPAPPPMPSVVQYPHGRYELRGDGWVWVPTPPAPPPPAPPAALHQPPAPVEPPQERPPSASRSVTPAHEVKLYLGAGKPPQSVQLYRWTDEQGVVHWADRADAVPARYRAQAKSAPPP